MFDRDMTSLMGYILGISCNISPTEQIQNVLTKPNPRPLGSYRPSSSTLVSYSDTREFLNLMKSGAQAKQGLVKEGDKIRERKHVRFKAEPQIHIIESDNPTTTTPSSWSMLDRPYSAPALISPKVDNRYNDQSLRINLSYPNFDDAKPQSGEKLDYPIYPGSTTNHRLTANSWLPDHTLSRLRSSVSWDKTRNYVTSSHVTSSHCPSMMEGGLSPCRTTRIRSCWEANKFVSKPKN